MRAAPRRTQVVWSNSQQVTKQDYEEWGPVVVHRKCS
jgi:actin-related protein